MKTRILFFFHMQGYELHISVYTDDIWVSHLTFQYMLDGHNHLVYRTQNSSIWMLIDTFKGSTRYVFKYPLKVTLDELIWPCLKTFPKFKKDNCPKWYKAWVWYSPAVIKHTKTFITISGTNTSLELTEEFWLPYNYQRLRKMDIHHYILGTSLHCSDYIIL